MDNQEVIKEIKKYLLQNNTVEIKWFIKEHLREEKNSREIDIINQGVINGIWFINYNGHNPDDISIKYSKGAKIRSLISTFGGIIGLIGGIFGIIAFFKK